VSILVQQRLHKDAYIDLMNINSLSYPIVAPETIDLSLDRDALPDFVGLESLYYALEDRTKIPISQTIARKMIVLVDSRSLIIKGTPRFSVFIAVMNST
jgi:hypothetical protein